MLNKIKCFLGKHKDEWISWQIQTGMFAGKVPDKWGCKYCGKVRGRYYESY